MGRSDREGRKILAQNEFRERDWLVKRSTSPEIRCYYMRVCPSSTSREPALRPQVCEAPLLTNFIFQDQYSEKGRDEL